MKIGIIGGSGLEDPKLLEDFKVKEVETPFGKPSSPLTTGRIGSIDVVIISRHGLKHEITPTEVNNRANIFALKDEGCKYILATTAVGSLREEIKRGDFVILDQFIDLTKHRKETFFDKFEFGAVHTQMANPFSEPLRKKLIESCEKLKFPNHKKGTVITIEGPRFSTRAESNLFRQWGASVVNMSIAPESALKEGNGTMIAKMGKTETLYSRKNACPEHNISLGDIQPRDFSFNSPFGACPECHGLGFKMEFDPDLIMPDRSKSILEGAITCYGRLMEGGWRMHTIREVAQSNGIDIEAPVSEIPKEKLDKILYGTKETMHFTYQSKKGDSRYEYDSDFEGVIPQLERLYHQTQSEARKEEIAKFMREKTCPKCNGKRLKDEMLSVTVGEKNIIDICELSITKTKNYLAASASTYGESERKISAPILKEINSRLEFLENVGLSYLNLSRESATLSGGESQRIRLATQIGSNLTGIIYVLDEPSIGLHQKDNAKLLSTLKRLRDLGNTLVVVEHDEETMREADHVIDMGPGAGRLGGEIVAQGSIEDIQKCGRSITGDYLAGRKHIEIRKKRRNPKGKLTLIGVKENNLKDLTVEFPLGVLVCVSGVSGSGKSSLIAETLYPALSNVLNRSRLKTGKLESVRGMEQLDKIITVDQSPIGRTPRSNPATYTGAFTPIRDLFARTEESKARGYGPGRFSFNVAQGRCENCEGDGLIKIAMHFLADVYVPCEVCKGKRYDSQTLEILYKSKNIADVLDMSVDEASEFFQNIPAIRNKLVTIQDVGLGYMKLGQPATTLSGGEAQRVKLANELSRRSTGATMYLLDEPTTGLHFDDVNKLLQVLQRLVDKGNSVIVIEHNLDVLKCADHIIDLGPDGGDDGGMIIAQGTPEQISKVSKSYTGQYLKGALTSAKRSADPIDDEE